MSVAIDESSKVDQVAFDAYARDFANAVAQELSALRKAQDVPYKALSERTGISERNLFRKLKGEIPIDVGELSRIAFEFEVSPAAVIRAADERVRRRPGTSH